MNKHRLLSTLTAAMLLSATVAFPLVQVQGAAPPVLVPPEVVRACVGVERIPESSLRAPSACAVALQASLNANDADVALLMAAKGPNAINVKRILIKHGLTEQQLEGAQIRFAKIEMDYPARIKITITCCPLTIIIAF